MSQLIRVLEELETGPATSRDIADATGLQLKHASHYLAELAGMGLAVRSTRRIRIEGRQGPGAYLYEMATSRQRKS